jgi:hypothetical protein
VPHRERLEDVLTATSLLAEMYHEDVPRDLAARQPDGQDARGVIKEVRLSVCSIFLSS